MAGLLLGQIANGRKNFSIRHFVQQHLNLPVKELSTKDVYQNGGVLEENKIFVCLSFFLPFFFFFFFYEDKNKTINHKRKRDMKTENLEPRKAKKSWLHKNCEMSNQT